MSSPPFVGTSGMVFHRHPPGPSDLEGCETCVMSGRRAALSKTAPGGRPSFPAVRVRLKPQVSGRLRAASIFLDRTQGELIEQALPLYLDEAARQAGVGSAIRDYLLRRRRTTGA